jgi:dipeptidyl-peptidase-4
LLTPRSALLRCSVLILAAAATLTAQQPAAAPRTLTAADYAQAEKFLPYNVNPLVVHGSVRATWISEDHFWYRDSLADGASQYMLVNAATGASQPAFDHAKIAAALSQAEEKTYAADKLPFQSIEFSADQKSMTFMVPPRRYRCDLTTYQCTQESGPPPAPPGQQRPGEGQTRERVSTRAALPQRGAFPPMSDTISPDKKLAAFIRDWNLWVRDIATGKETQLTTDGVKDYGYATDNAGWRRSTRPVLLWSPDSKKIATFQQDQRKTGEMYLVNTQVGHPKLEAWKYPLPGDEDVTMIERVVIGVDAPKIIRFQMPPDQHRSTLCDDLVCRGTEWADVEWTPDSTHVAFVSSSRDHKVATLRIADAATGAVRTVLEEKVATQYESGNGRVNWRYLPASNEVLWWSERSNWGHLYLYDANTGQLKHQITRGDWQVAQLLRVDEKNRVLYFLGQGREKGENPYFPHLYKIGLDGSNLTLLTPEPAHHDITMSPKGPYFVDTYSTPETPGVTVVRDLNGKLIATVAKTDVSRLQALNWKPPVLFSVKCRDGVTDCYGVLIRPTNFDATKKYPVINQIYPGPQGGSVGNWGFAPVRGDTQALAELGFVVVELESMGNPGRSKSFHDKWYGDMGDNGLPDQVAGMKELAQRYPWMDLDRVGIWGHSGGGFATADAMFRYPDFFKAGIAESGNHDNRDYEDDWGERYQGLLVKNPDGTTNYDNQANQLVAKNLKGHLLLAHGTMDDNVPPYNTLLVVDALIKANKDFDLLLLPNQPHGYGAYSSYMMRRRWDYFVRWVLGAEPPAGYELKPPPPFGGRPPGM